MGGKLHRKNKKGKKKERKTEVIFIFLIYFCLFYGKRTFVWLLVDNSWIVCCCLLPDSYGQTKKMARGRLLSSAIVIDVFYSRNIQDRSLLKVYNKDPAHAFNHTPKTLNGDMRVSVPVLFLILFGELNHLFFWYVLLMKSHPTTRFWVFSPLIWSDDSFVFLVEKYFLVIWGKGTETGPHTDSFLLGMKFSNVLTPRGS